MALLILGSDASTPDENPAEEPVSEETSPVSIDVQSWLIAAAGNPTLERVGFGPRYLGRQDHRDHKQRDKLLLVAPGIPYESKLSHGAIPTCFRTFITNRAYLSPTELAVYVRVLMLMKPDGICYEHHREISEGLFSQPKQVGPVLQRLVDKHLLILSDGDLVIPWAGRSRREVIQRPSAAYTIARLHYLGFIAEEKAPDGRVKSSPRRYLDQTCFDRSVETLLHFYSKKGTPGAQRPRLSLLAIRQFLYETYLTDEERATSPKVDADFFNPDSQPGEEARPKRGRPRMRIDKAAAT